MDPTTRDEIIKKIESLKPLPDVAFKVIALIDDPKSRLDDMKREILKDQALTANVLRICNSPYYGFSRKITNISTAIAMIGTNAVRDIILSATFSHSYDRKVSGYSLERGELAKHSICSALAAEVIAQKAGFGEKETAFVAALLHDIGKLIIDQFIKDKFTVIIERVRREQKSFSQIEKEELLFDHAEIGGMVVESWNLPPVLVKAISFHHNPSDLIPSQESTDNSINQLVSIVHLANIITLMLGVGCGADGLACDLHDSALETLGLTGEDIESIISMMPEKLELVNQFTET